MAALPSAPFVAFVTFSWIFGLTLEDEMKVKPGEKAILNCMVPRDAVIKAFEWTRPDLEKEGYVFFYENNLSKDKYQHPSFHGRVAPRDKSSIQEGDVSVVLRNVTESDAGVYDCLVSLRTTRRKRDLPKLMRTITLKVEDSGPTAGHREEGGDEERGDKEGGVQNGGNKNEHVGRVFSLSLVLLLGIL